MLGKTKREAALSYLDNVGILNPRSGSSSQVAGTLYDSGASVCLLSAKTAISLGILVYRDHTLLTTSTQDKQQCVGLSEPLFLQLGLSLPNCITVPFVALVVDGVDRLFHLLLSNETSYRFRAIVNYGDSNVTFFPNSDLPTSTATTSSPVVLPLRRGMP